MKRRASEPKSAAKKTPAKKRGAIRRGFLPFLLVCVAGFLIAGAVALYNAARILQLNEPPMRSDALVVPGGSPVRSFHAARLYRDGYAPMIYVGIPVETSGDAKIRKAGIAWPREEELAVQILLKEGVPRHAVSLYGPAKSTAEEAEVLARTHTKKPCSLLAVTSPYHTRRVSIVFRDAMPECAITVASTPDEAFPDAWWQSQDAARQVVLEIMKILFYKAGGRYYSPTPA